MSIRTIETTLIFLLLGLALRAQSVVGTWRTIDDNTGEAKSLVKIYKEGDRVYGKVIKLLREHPSTAICSKCTDERKDQPIVGMVVMKDMKQDGRYWRGGNILDPEKGRVYTCKIWLAPDNPDKLYVRGYIGPFFRTQNWYRVE